MYRRNHFVITFIIIVMLTFACASPEEDETSVVASSDYADLVSLFKEFREFVKPTVTNGVPDYTAGQFIAAHASDPKRALQGVESAPLKILLAHQPRNIFDAAAAGYHLQISGHTHGGQYIPWSYLVTLTQPYIAGLHRHAGTWIYVSRGTGYWGPPLRIGVPSEVTLLKLKVHHTV